MKSMYIRSSISGRRRRTGSTLGRHRPSRSPLQTPPARNAGLGDELASILVNGLTRYAGTEANNNLLPSLEEAGCQ